MLDDILWNSDGFGVVDSLLLRSGIKDWWKRDRSPPSSRNTFTFDTYYHSNPDINSSPTTYLILDTHPFENMSLTRQLFNEFRPFFRMFDDAAFRPFAVHHHPSRRFRGQEFEDPFESLFSRASPFGSRAAKVELTEEGNNYVIQAELPGVKKENLDVTVGDNGRSITIEGRVFARSADSQLQEEVAAATADATKSPESSAVASQAADQGPSSSSSTAVTHQQQGGSENDAVVQATTSSPGQWETRSSFSRTIWLPRPVDSGKVSGKLEDGVLRLEIPKMEEESGRTKINVQ